MRYRTITIIVTLALGILLAPLAADAQPAGKVYRIGWVGASDLHISPFLSPFLRGLRALGWDRQDFVMEDRWAWGNYERFPPLAAELVSLKVDVIVAVSAPATLAAMNATKTIPIVFTMVGDPVDAGFVASLARPGGNITGLTNLSAELSVKLLELLKEVVPGAARVAVLRNPTNPVSAPQLRWTQLAAQVLGVQLQVVDVRDPNEFESAFLAMTREHAGAFTVLADPMLLSNRTRIAELAVKYGLAATFNVKEYAEAGGLISYGPSLVELWRRLATYGDKILKGAKPADLPVEQPMKFELVVNLKTAKALGLTIPQSILIRADEVIQ